jgi:hypothetical protein
VLQPMVVWRGFRFSIPDGQRGRKCGCREGESGEVPGVRVQRGGWKCRCREGESREVPGVRAQRGGLKCGCQEGESGNARGVREPRGRKRGGSRSAPECAGVIGRRR